MSTKRLFTAACLLLALDGAFLAPSAAGAAPPRTFEDAVPVIEARVEPATVDRGKTAALKIHLKVAPGWHTYPSRQADEGASSFVNKFDFAPSGDVFFAGKLRDPRPVDGPEGFLKVGSDKVEILENDLTWEQDLVVNPDAKPGKKSLPFRITVVVCDSAGCLPPQKVDLNADLTVSTADPVPVEPRYQSLIASTGGGDPFNPTPGPAPAPPQPSPVPPRKQETPSVTQGAVPPVVAPVTEEGTLRQPSSAAYAEQMDALADQVDVADSKPSDLLSFVLAGVFWGAVSLITPCVFPMIPITVSFFLKQSEKHQHRALTMAAVYCLTIIVVLSLGALLLLGTFVELSRNPIMNYAMGVLFIAFALSLFGMYDIELPSGLARFTSAREGRGGLVGTMFMALTFTILSFACVAPFLGGFGGTASMGNLNWFERFLGALAFATTFAAPFFFLALFPGLLKKMPKSGTWLNSVKVVMGFLELAAAFKFLRLGELMGGTPSFFTYDLVLGVWVALSLLAGLYLLNVYRLPHDTPIEHLGVPRLLFSAVFLSLGFYLLPALFKYNAEGEKQRPNGVVYAWVDSFLLPESTTTRGALAWSGDLKLALDEARDEHRRTGKRKLLFVDVTGKS